MTNTILHTFDTWINAQGLKSQGRNRSLDNISLEGIARLRELILELAVRGKLLPQNLKDEKVTSIFQKLFNNSPSEIAIAELPFTLPESWMWCKFDDIAILRHGHQFRKEDFVDNGIPVIKISQCKADGTLDLSNCDFISTNRIDEFKDFLIKKDELLMALTGGTLGKVTRIDKDYGVVVQNYRVGNFFTKNENIFSIDYFNIILESELFQGLVKNKINQNAQPNIGKENIEKLLIPLPPLAEQHRIVEKVDELMALCDALEEKQTRNLHTHQLLVETLLETLTQAKTTEELQAAWQRLATCFDTLFTTEESVNKLKQTILQLAVMGKLTEDFRKSNPELVSGSNSASALLEQIATEKERLVKEGKLKKQEKLPPINEDEKPFELPEGWKWERIGSSVLFSEYGLSEKTYDIKDGVPLIKMGDIQDGIVLIGGQKYVSKDVEGLPDLYLKKLDILYNRTNSADLVGKTGIFEGPDDMYTFASYLIRIRCSKNYLLPNYLNLAMNAPFFRHTQIKPHLKQQCGQANVNGTIMRNMMFPFPPLADQQRIVEMVDELFALCDTLKARIANAQKIENQLATAVVEAAVR
jgi:type I restriction enzyme, S subunit